MKRFLTISLFICSLSSLSYSQKLALVSSNTVAEDLVVHTFKLSNISEKESDSYSDVNPAKISAEIDKMLAQMKEEIGVTRATFDAATQTVTVLSDKAFNANTILNKKYLQMNNDKGGEK